MTWDSQFSSSGVAGIALGSSHWLLLACTATHRSSCRMLGWLQVMSKHSLNAVVLTVTSSLSAIQHHQPAVADDEGIPRTIGNLHTVKLLEP